MVDNCLISKSNSEHNNESERIAAASTTKSVNTLNNKITAAMGDVVGEIVASGDVSPPVVDNKNNGHLERRATDEDVILIDDSSSDSSAAPRLVEKQPVVVAISTTTTKNDDEVKPVEIPATSSVTSSSGKAGKSILENFLTRPMMHPPPPIESPAQQPALVVETRKVEPLKINLHREPIKTVIKIPHVEHSPKITIKPLKPPNDQVDNATAAAPQQTVPKLHIKNLNESPSVEIKKNSTTTVSSADNCAEPHIVPKLTIRNLHHSTNANSAIDNGSSSGGSSDAFHAVVPKLTIKIDNHHHHHHATSHSPVESQRESKHKKAANADGEGVITSEGESLKLQLTLCFFLWIWFKVQY